MRALTLLLVPLVLGGKDSVTVLTPRGARVVEGAQVAGQSLWIPAAFLPEVTGYHQEGETLCAGEQCIVPPTDGAWLREREGVPQVDVTAVASHLGQAWVADVERRTWSFSNARPGTGAAFVDGVAPDFTLVDRAGEDVSLSDFRGKKVLLLAWASW